MLASFFGLLEKLKHRYSETSSIYDVEDFVNVYYIIFF